MSKKFIAVIALALLVEIVLWTIVFNLSNRLSAVETQVDCNLSQRVEVCVDLCHEKVASYDDSTGTCTCQQEE